MKSFAIAIAGSLLVLASLPAVAQAQNLLVDPSVLHLRATQSADGRWHSTPPRTIRIERTDTAVVQWRAEATVPWLTVTPASGAGPGRIKVQAEASRLNGARSASGEVVISVNGVPFQRVSVHASVVPIDNPPLGFVDAPPDGDRPEGPARFFGWALDDVGVSTIEICRAGDGLPGEQRCADGKGFRVAQAELHASARPDVAAAVPGFDHEGDTGWTALVSMPPTRAPDDATTYYAVARDVTGQLASVGTKNYRVSAAPVVWAEVLKFPALLLLAFVVFAAFHLLARRWLPAGENLPQTSLRPPQPRTAWLELTALFAIMAAFAWIAIPGLSRSLDYDEMYSASQFIVDRSWWESATRVQTSNNHFGNSILASLAVRVLGPHEWVVRLPAFVLGLGAIFVTWRFGRRLAGPVTGLGAAALLAASPVFLLWGQSARGYSGLACMAWLSVDAFFRVLRTGDPRQARVHTISTAILPLFHLFGLWILAIQYLGFWLWTLLLRRIAPATGSADGLRRLHRSFLAIGAVTLLMFLPSVTGLVSDLPVFAVSHQPAASATGAIPGAAAAKVPSTGRSTVGVQWSSFDAELLSFRSWNLTAIAVGLVLIGLLSLAKGEAALGIATLALPLFILWMAGPAVTVYPRFFSFWLPMLAILLAAGMVAPLQWQRRLTTGVQKGALIVMGIATVVGGLQVARTWLDHGRPAIVSGYRDWLTRAPEWTDSPAAVVGQDAFMFDFYLGKPAPLVSEVAQMDGLLRQNDRLLVAFHTLPRMRLADLQLREMLLRRCLDKPHGNITLFECR